MICIDDTPPRAVTETEECLLRIQLVPPYKHGRARSRGLALSCWSERNTFLAISQFVREFRAANPPLDAAKDRLVMPREQSCPAVLEICTIFKRSFLKKRHQSCQPNWAWLDSGLPQYFPRAVPNLLGGFFPFL